MSPDSMLPHDASPIKSNRSKIPRVRPATAIALAQCLNDANAFLQSHVVFAEPGQSEIAVLWAASHYALDATDNVMHLLARAPTKRSGKSRLLQCLAMLTPNAQLDVNVSVSALMFDMNRDKDKPSLYIDEIQDAFSGENRAPLQILLKAAIERGTTIPRRIMGNDSEIGETIRYRIGPNPIGLAGVNPQLSDTILDRCIPINLRRKTRDEKTDRWSYRKARKDGEAIGVKISIVLETILDWLAEANPYVPMQLEDNDRAVEGTRLMLAIADAAGQTWPQIAREALTQILGSKEDYSISERLLRDLQIVFDANATDRMITAEIMTSLIALENTDSPWAAMWGRDFPLTEEYQRYTANPRGAMMKFSELLAPFGIKTHVMRIGKNTARGLTREDLADSFRRYLPDSEK